MESPRLPLAAFRNSPLFVRFYSFLSELKNFSISSFLTLGTAMFTNYLFKKMFNLLSHVLMLLHWFLKMFSPTYWLWNMTEPDHVFLIKIFYKMHVAQPCNFLPLWQRTCGFLLTTPLWLLKIALFSAYYTFRHRFFCIDLAANNFFKIVNTNLEHPVFHSDQEISLAWEPKQKEKYDPSVYKYLTESSKYDVVNR